jgi:restriction endonuclease BglII
MGLELIPESLNTRYHIEERWHACAILARDFPEQFQDIIDCLNEFQLVRSEVIAWGGRKTKIASRFDQFLCGRGWQEKKTSIAMSVDGKTKPLSTSALKLAPFSLRFQHFAAKAKSEMGNDACENNRVFLASV